MNVAKMLPVFIMDVRPGTSRIENSDCDKQFMAGIEYTIRSSLDFKGEWLGAELRWHVIMEPSALR